MNDLIIRIGKTNTENPDDAEDIGKNENSCKNIEIVNDCKNQGDFSKLVSVIN